MIWLGIFFSLFISSMLVNYSLIVRKKQIRLFFPTFHLFISFLLFFFWRSFFLWAEIFFSVFYHERFQNQTPHNKPKGNATGAIFQCSCDDFTFIMKIITFFIYIDLYFNNQKQILSKNISIFDLSKYFEEKKISKYHFHISCLFWGRNIVPLLFNCNPANLVWSKYLKKYKQKPLNSLTIKQYSLVEMINKSQHRNSDS